MTDSGSCGQGKRTGLELGLLPSPKGRCLRMNLPVSHPRFLLSSGLVHGGWATADQRYSLRVPCLTKGLHLHDSAPDCHHLRLCTVAAMESEDDLAACWGPIAQVKHPASPGALPMSSRVSCCFTGHHRWSWSGLRCLRFPSEFFAPGIFASVFQRAAASRSSILAGMQPPGHP